MSKSITFFRRKYLVDKPFQLGITSYILSFYFIALIALYLFIRFSIHSSVEGLKDLDPLNFSTLDLFMEHTLNVLNFAFIVFGLIGAFFAFLGGIIMTNKISGPLYRLQKIIQQMTNREYKSHFKVRKNDYCAALYTDLEKLEESLLKTSQKN